jgi:Sigma-70, region 4
VYRGSTGALGEASTKGHHSVTIGGSGGLADIFATLAGRRFPSLAARVCRQLRGTATALNTRGILTVGGRDNGSRCRSRSCREFGISRERVRQIEMHAFKKMRSDARRRDAAIDPWA